MVDNVIIMGAAGRDFHNFNVYFRNNPNYNVVAFTATQIPNIDERIYPAVLAGAERYPNGIPIKPESKLPELIKKFDVKQVIFGYSDISYISLMHKSAMVLSNGADFRLMGPNNTTLKSVKPVISVCAVRTGAGKSPVTQKVCRLLKDHGLRVVAIRHPMPYGDLSKQIWQRYETIQDMVTHDCTIEEREEYEPHINNGIIVYAGVDYAEILKRAETEADIIVWDGGNNDLSFYKPDLHIVITDPHRPNHEVLYHPGETNLRLADVVIINKIATADRSNIEIVRNNIHSVNPNAKIIEVNSPVKVDDPEMVKGKRVLVVEDGPTVTHGEMPYGAAFLAARELGAAEVIDPHKNAVGSIKKAFGDYPHLKSVLPAMGYGQKQVKELEASINASDCDLVLSGTPIDLNHVIQTNKTIVRVRYSIDDLSEPNLKSVIDEFVKKHVRAQPNSTSAGS